MKFGTKKVPAAPGVYFFKNQKGLILYIGKAANLKNRIKSYFAGQPTNSRLAKLLETAAKVTWQETDSEIEALILESQLIKKHRPPFNVMLRDDKQYFYVGFSNEQFPKVTITHRLHPHTKRPQAALPLLANSGRYGVGASHSPQFLGPFTNGQALKVTLKLLRRIFPYCTCKQKHNNYCLNYHIGKCLGFCCLKNHETCNMKHETKRYNQNIRAIKEVLSGKRMVLIKALKTNMEKLAKQENFEEAAGLRDKIEKLEKVFENARIISGQSDQLNQFFDKSKYQSADKKSALIMLRNFLKLDTLPHRIEGYDIANIQGKFATGAMVVFTNGQPDKNQYRKFKIKIGQQPNDTAMLKEVLTRRFNHSEWPWPDLIIVDGGKAQLNVVKHVTYNMPALGKPKATRPRPSRDEVGRPGKHKKKIPVIALTKDEKHQGTKIFVDSKKTAIPLSKLPSAVRNLILRVDSEAHHFAIGYYRKLHKSSLSS